MQHTSGRVAAPSHNPRPPGAPCTLGECRRGRQWWHLRMRWSDTGWASPREQPPTPLSSCAQVFRIVSHLCRSWVAEVTASGTPNRRSRMQSQRSTARVEELKWITKKRNCTAERIWNVVERSGVAVRLGILEVEDVVGLLVLHSGVVRHVAVEPGALVLGDPPTHLGVGKVVLVVAEHHVVHRHVVQH